MENRINCSSAGRGMFGRLPNRPCNMKDDNYEEIVAHGYRILRDMMWDSEDGRPHTLLSIDGDSLEVLSTGKSVYAIHSLIGMIAMLKGGFILSKMHIDS